MIADPGTRKPLRDLCGIFALPGMNYDTAGTRSIARQTIEYSIDCGCIGGCNHAFPSVRRPILVKKRNEKRKSQKRQYVLDWYLLHSRVHVKTTLQKRNS